MNYLIAIPSYLLASFICILWLLYGFHLINEIEYKDKKYTIIVRETLSIILLLFVSLGLFSLL